MTAPASLDDNAVRGLWASVIVQAIKDMDSRILCDGRVAKNWMYAARHNNVGSFEWICEMLGLDADRIRTICLTRDGRKRLKNNNEGNRRRKQRKETPVYELRD